MRIIAAQPKDAAEILALQVAAYQSEAALYNDPNIPPLCQTVGELRDDIEQMTVLVAVEEGQILGSVRGRLDGTTCHIGRLIVAPDQQNQGIGSQLMEAIESAFPHAAEFELFTGHRSQSNLRFYERRGYLRVREQRVHAELTMVYLVKRP